MSRILSVRLVGVCTVAAATAAFAVTGGCSSSSSDSARSSGGAAGASAAGGSTTAGTGNPAGGNGTAGSGTAGSGTAGSGTAGSGTAGGSSTCTETNTTDMCDTTGTPNLYSGMTTAPTCGSTILALPNATSPNTYWFSYGDATAGATKTAGGEKCGCAGPSDCAFHAFGSGYADYGAGIGFDVNEDTTSSHGVLPYDASMYMGVRLWLRGTTAGTRGKGYSDSPNTVHVKLVTATDRHGDDYGFYCPISTDWSECDVPFNMAYRDGFCTPASAETPPCLDTTADTFDSNQLEKVQIEFSSHQVAADGGAQVTPIPVSFDVWADDITIY